MAKEVLLSSEWLASVATNYRFLALLVDTDTFDVPLRS